jgi:HEAT repeat protein
VRALRNPDGPAVEARAEAVLSHLGPGIADRVLGALGDGATPALVRAAGFLGDARIVEPVIAQLGSRDVEMRRAAAAAAGALNHTRAVPALLTATQDAEQPVRDAASAALNRMGMAAVIAGLAQIVGHDSTAQILPRLGGPQEVGAGNGERVLPAQLLAQTRRAVAGGAAAPAVGRRGGLVDRLLGRAR